jgi:hypothetical protein
LVFLRIYFNPRLVPRGSESSQSKNNKICKIKYSHPILYLRREINPVSKTCSVGNTRRWKIPETE